MFRIVLAAGDAGQHNGLIADDAYAAIYRGRIDAPKPAVRLGGGNKEGCMQAIGLEPVETAINELLTRHGDKQ